MHSYIFTAQIFIAEVNMCKNILFPGKRKCSSACLQYLPVESRESFERKLHISSYPSSCFAFNRLVSKAGTGLRKITETRCLEQHLVLTNSIMGTVMAVCYRY